MWNDKMTGVIKRGVKIKVFSVIPSIKTSAKSSVFKSLGSLSLLCSCLCCQISLQHRSCVEQTSHQKFPTGWAVQCFYYELLLLLSLFFIKTGIINRYHHHYTSLKHHHFMYAAIKRLFKTCFVFSNSRTARRVDTNKLAGDSWKQTTVAK